MNFSVNLEIQGSLMTLVKGQSPMSISVLDKNTNREFICLIASLMIFLTFETDCKRSSHTMSYYC